MSVAAFPFVLAEAVAMSTLCRNSLTDAQVWFARAALRGLDPEWSLDCCESCEADWFLDLSSMRPDGRVVSFIIHARDGAIHLIRMVDDDHTLIGRFDDMAQATSAVIAAIMTGPG